MYYATQKQHLKLIKKLSKTEAESKKASAFKKKRAILFYHVFLFYFLIPAAIVQIFILIAELVVPIEIPSKEAKAEDRS